MIRPPGSVSEVLGAAWVLSWRNPILWIFGIFVGGGSGGGRLMSRVGTVEEFSPASLALVLAGIGALVLVFLALGTIAAGALVGGVDRAARGPRPRFREALGDGLRAFWRMLGLFIVVLVLALPLLIPLLPGILLLVQKRLLAGLGALCVGLLFDLVLGIVLGVTAAFAMRFVALEGTGPLHALREGFSLFTDRPGRSVGLALVQLAVTIGLTLVAIVPLTLLAVPFVALALGGGGTRSVAAAVLLGLVAAPFVLLLAGWWGTFSSAYWTLAWRWWRPWPEPTPPTPEEPGA